MGRRLLWAAVISLCACVQVVRAQGEGAQDVADDGERGTRVPLAQASTAFDASGREALSAGLLTQALAATAEAPVRNVRVVVRNAGGAFFNYVAGYATFYDEGGVRCGAGLFTFGAAEPGERVEVDTPGLRLTCTPASWRVVATALLTAAGDVAQPAAAQAARNAPTPTPSAAPAGAVPPAAAPPLEINVNGKTIPIQLGNPLDIQVGNERVRIVVRPAP